MHGKNNSWDGKQGIRDDKQTVIEASGVDLYTER